MNIRNGIERLLLPRDMADRRRAQRETRDLAQLPDRRMLADHYIPAVAEDGGRILWVGTQPYTALNYDALSASGGVVWTCDIDPEAARWGHPQWHRTGDVREIDRVFFDIRFKTVIYSGVAGFGVDTLEDQAQALAAIARVLSPGGVLIFGWNTDRTGDPFAIGVIGPEFAPTPYADHPSRVVFPGSTHVYDVLCRI